MFAFFEKLYSSHLKPKEFLSLEDPPYLFFSRDLLLLTQKPMLAYSALFFHAVAHLLTIWDLDFRLGSFWGFPSREGGNTKDAVKYTEGPGEAGKYRIPCCCRKRIEDEAPEMRNNLKREKVFERRFALFHECLTYILTWGGKLLSSPMHTFVAATSL